MKATMASVEAKFPQSGTMWQEMSESCFEKGSWELCLQCDMFHHNCFASPRKMAGYKRWAIEASIRGIY